MNQNKVKQATERYEQLIEYARKRRAEKERVEIPQIHVGMATCGLAAGAAETKSAFEEELSLRHIEASVLPVGCLGHCYAEPLVVISNPGFPPSATIT